MARRAIDGTIRPRHPYRAPISRRVNMPRTCRRSIISDLHRAAIARRPRAGALLPQSGTETLRGRTASPQPRAAPMPELHSPVPHTHPSRSYNERCTANDTFLPNERSAERSMARPPSHRDLTAVDTHRTHQRVPVHGHDTVVDCFITELGRSMASRTSRAELDWRFAVVNSSEVTAFALPGHRPNVEHGG